MICSDDEGGFVSGRGREEEGEREGEREREGLFGSREGEGREGRED